MHGLMYVKTYYMCHEFLNVGVVRPLYWDPFAFKALSIFPLYSIASYITALFI